jgi:cobalt-zinc-cadmium efflux system protein
MVIVVAQIVWGIAAHSVGLLADAGHNLSDAAALIISMIAVRLARRSPKGRHSFGYHRATILAAQANAAAILVVTGILAFEAARRLGHPSPVQGATVAVVAALAMVVNLVAARFLHDGSGDLNMRSAWLHMMGDAAASAGVLVAGLVIASKHGWYWLDPLVSLVIAALIIWRAVALLRETATVLLEAAPARLDLDTVSNALGAVLGVESVHDLHAWTLSSDVDALSAHLVLDGHPTLEEAQVVGARAKQLLAERFSIAHATLELECETCAPDPADACAIHDLNVSEPSGHVGHSHAGHRH